MDDPTAITSLLKLTLCDCHGACESRTRLDNMPLCHALIRLLAGGKPLTLVELARVTGLEFVPLKAKLDSMDLDYDDEGRVIGAGLTLRETPHRFVVGGHNLFTWCALDALMYPSLLTETVYVESPCRVTGQLVKVTVTPGGVRDVDPAEAVVSLVRPQPGQSPRLAFCGEVHFFSSAAAAQPWLAARPNAGVVPVATAYELGNELMAERGKR